MNYTILAIAHSSLSLSSALAAVSIVGLLIVAAGVVGGSYRISRNTQTVANYREAAHAWELKAGAQDQKIAEQADMIKSLQEREVRKDQQLAELSATVAMLKDLATGKSFITLLEAKTAEILALCGENRTELQSIKAQLAGSAK